MLKVFMIKVFKYVRFEYDVHQRKSIISAEKYTYDNTRNDLFKHYILTSDYVLARLNVLLDFVQRTLISNSDEYRLTSFTR